VLGAYTADQLDIIDFFEQPELSPPHRDWHFSGVSFRRKEFEAMCTAIAQFIATSVKP
jgi:hypothetical protein